MGRDYTDADEETAGWDAGFVAPMRAEAPRALAGLRLDQALARMFPQYSRNRLQAWLAEGHIRVDGEPAAPRRIVRGGERVDLAPPVPPPGAAPKAQRIPLKVVYEDDALVVIDKPAGLVVHPGAGVPDRTLMNALLAHAPQVAGVPRAGIVHRLDKDTTGLIVVAKTVEAQVSLVRQLAERRMRRVYWAVVHGDPPAGGVIDAPVGRDKRARTRMAVTRRGKDAVTRYRVLERYGRAALLECRLETGRTHQIRVHFQHLRYPLVGEATYGRGTRHGIAFPRQALHAVEVSLAHPSSGEPMTWRVAPPGDFRRLLARLRDHA
jgi:23S rRNA pseudouridine1911/1915/1917 synthase